MQEELDPWWEGKKPHERMIPFLLDLNKRQGYRDSLIVWYLQLYKDRDMDGFAPDTYISAASAHEPRAERMSLNVVRNATDTAVSHLVKSMPKISVVTNGGDASLQTKAKQRERLIAGMFQEGEAEEKRQAAVQMAALLGTGCIKVYELHGRVAYEPVFTGEITVDDDEAIYGEPRSIYQNRAYSRDVLKRRYPRHKQAIDDAAASAGNRFRGNQATNQIMVREGWHLPSSPGAGDGRHAICIEGATLFEEEWTRDNFPFAWWHWTKDPLGFWASGLAEQLQGIQQEINEILTTFKTAVYMGGNMKVFVEHGSNVTDAHLGNDPRGQIVNYTGQPPIFSVNNVMSPQILEHLWNLVEQSYEITGISRMNATGDVPSNLQSGRAQLVAKQTSSQRFSNVVKQDERAVRDLARLSLQVVEEIVERDGDYSVNCKEENWLSEISAKDAVFEDKKCAQLSAIPSSSMPETLAGRLELSEQLFNRGLISPSTSAKLLDMPDIQADSDLLNAPLRLIDRQIEHMLEKGEGQTPDPRLPLEEAFSRGNNSYLLGVLRGVPPDNLVLLGDWLNKVQEMQAKAAAAAAPPPAPGAPMPGAASPMPPDPTLPAPPPGAPV